MELTNKPVFMMCVGIPGCGKSTWCETHKEELNLVIHSSDAIREEFGDVNDQSKNELVFNTLHRRIKEDLLNGKNVCYDATNLNRKRRINFINNELRDIPCEKICMLFATPIIICRKNNRSRERKVPDEVITRMYKNFEVPCKQEGWNDIKIEWWNYRYEGLEFDFINDVEKWTSISHDNPHHTLSIGDHMIDAYRHMCCKTDDFLLQAAAYMHDCGKIITKAKIDSKGNPSEIAHYYEHHNVSAYLSMFYLKDMFEEESMKLKDSEILHISLLINLHMRPFLAWNKSEKAKEKDRRLFGDDIIAEVEILHECDLAAH